MEGGGKAEYSIVEFILEDVTPSLLRAPLLCGTSPTMINKPESPGSVTVPCLFFCHPSEADVLNFMPLKVFVPARSTANCVPHQSRHSSFSLIAPTFTRLYRHPSSLINITSSIFLCAVCRANDPPTYDAITTNSRFPSPSPDCSYIQ